MSEIARMEQYCLEASSTATGQPAKMLAALVGQLLKDVQDRQIAPFQQLRSKLQSDAFAWDNALLTHSVQAMLAASRNLDVQSLRNCGFWARLTGATERAAREFDNNYRDVLSAAAKARQELEILSRDYRAHASSARRLIVELDIECRVLNRDMDQGAEWLVELSYAIAEAGELRALSTRAMALSGQLKRFRTVSTLAQEITILGQNVLERRAALLEMVGIDLNGFHKVWVRRARIVAEAGNRRVPFPVLEKARQVHAELVTRLELTSAACLALQMDEQSMQRRLAMLRDCLEER
jgi:hypothetical protein